MKSKFLSGIVFIAAGLLLATGPYLLFPVCKGGMMVMRCHNTAKAELILGILMIAAGALTLITKSKKIRLWLNAATGLLAVLAILFPNAITGVCSKVHMSCRSLTLPSIAIISILLVFFTAVNTLYLFKQGNKGEIRDGTGIDPT